MTYLCTPLQIPELDMSIADGDKVAAIVTKTDGHHLSADLIRGDLYIGLPIKHIHDHVVLGANGHQIFAVRRECLQK